MSGEEDNNQAKPMEEAEDTCQNEQAKVAPDEGESGTANETKPASEEEETSQKKRSAEDVSSAEEPAPKRVCVEVTGSLQERVNRVIAALAKADLKVSWSDHLRHLLLAWAPASLGCAKDSRAENDEVMLRMLVEIFDSEEDNLEKSVERAEARVTQSIAKREKATEAKEEVEKDLRETAEDAKKKLEELPASVEAVAEAENKFRKSIHGLTTSRKDVFVSAKNDSFEVLKAGAWTDDSHRDTLVAEVMPLLKEHVKDCTLLSSSSNALANKPDQRGTFGETVVQQLTQHLEKALTSLEEECQAATEELNKQKTAAEASGDKADISFEQAVKMLNHARQIETAQELAAVEDAKAKSFAPLKSGSVDAKGMVRKHIAALKNVCRKVPDGKAMVKQFPDALQKKADDRNDTDNKVIDELEEALDNHLKSLQQNVGEEAAAEEAQRKKLESVFLEVKQTMELETEQRDAKQQPRTKEKESILELRDTIFEPLKSVGGEPPKQMLTKVKKLFKQLEIDDTTSKTLLGILKKKAGDRGVFDAALVSQFEETLNKTLAKFDQEISNADAEIKYGASAFKETLEIVEKAKDVFDQAQNAQLERLDDAVSTEKERQRLASLLESRQAALQERCDEEKEAEASHAAEKLSLAEFILARCSLATLRDRADGDAME